MTTAPYHRDMQCYVSSVSYDFTTRHGLLDMAHSCCDMKGCVDFFLKIDPNCERIETFNDNERDTAYRLRPEGWEAVEHRRDMGMGQFYKPDNAP